MLIVFDVDGTLLSSDSTDWVCFDAALEQELGFAPDRTFWDQLQEVTAPAIVEQAAAKHPPEQWPWLCKAIRARYLDGLRNAHEEKTGAFIPAPGAAELLAALRQQPGVTLAIATGDWAETIRFKLGAAGLDITDIPFASSSDAPRRAEIIRTAASRAGRPVEQAIYVGDGFWDLRATRELGIPLLGVGTRHTELRAAGAAFSLPDLQPGPFLAALEALRSA